MPSAVEEPLPFHIPTVDIAPFLADPTSEESQKIIADVRKACVSTGFFQIVNHGVPRALQQSIFAAAASFFALPFETKKAVDCKRQVGHRGYDVLASQSYEPDVLPDLKEGYYVGIDVAKDDPKVINKRFFMGPNVWPPSSDLSAETFREPVERYYATIFSLSITILDMIAATLPYGPEVFKDFTSNGPLAPLRLLHYPPAQQTTKRQLGASAHTDFGAITLLLQDGNPGLQVLDEAKNEWVLIQPNPDAYVVNIGDMLSKWTGDRYKSGVHRVINQNPTDRYSVVFFFDGNIDCKLDPLDGSEPAEGEEGLTVERHMIRRITNSYEKTK